MSSILLPHIVLPGLPHLEWMTENLTGFGGTEVGGHTYYTYDEAVNAVKQLGDGWRLPTPGESLDLVALGSDWQDEGPHGLPCRVFMGSLFLDATGYRSASGVLTEVGVCGYVWASPCAGSVRAMRGGLVISKWGADTLKVWRRMPGFPVRCVRNV